MRSNVGEEGITSKIQGKDLISVSNIVFGFLAIAYFSQEMFLAGFAFVFLGFIADSADGFVARKFYEPNDFGKRLDMADIASFGLAPAFFIYVFFDYSWSGLVLGSILVSAGLLRLARFQSKESNSEGFIGVPITFNALIFPFLYFIGSTAIISAYTVVISLLMVSSVKIPKLDLSKVGN